MKHFYITSIRAFFLMCFLLFASPSFYAQFNCTDVNPDIVNTGNSTQDIDLDNDGTSDFRITALQNSTVSLIFVQGGQIGTGNYVLGTTSGDALALTLGTVIDQNSMNWNQMNGGDQSMMIIFNSNVSGNWAGATDQYLGLKLISGANTFYGWARFTFAPAAASYTFQDYAYNTVSNQQILAGQGCPSLAFPVFALSPTLCVGSSANLTANTGTDTPNAYAWISNPPGAAFTASSGVSTAVSFSAAGVYVITLADIYGTNVGQGQQTVTVGFTPTLTSTGPVCVGQALTLSADSGVTYAWSGPSGFASSLKSPTLIPVSSGTLIYSVSLTTANGCTVATSESVTVIPLPTISIVPNSPSLCIGSPGILLNAATNATLLAWSPTLGLSGSGNSVTVDPGATTVYSLTGSLNGCTRVQTVSVNVQSIPTLSATTSGTNLCVFPFNGSSNSLSVSLSGATSDYSFTPSGSVTASGSGNNLVLTVPPLPGLITLTIQGTNAICATQTTLQVLVRPNPSITIIPTPYSLCPGDPVTITASGGINYFWSAFQAPLSSTTGSAITSTPGPTSVYFVYGSDLICNSATHNATLNILPQPKLTAADVITCPDAPATLSVQGADTYLWSGPGNYTAATSDASITAPPDSGTITYTVTGTNSSVNSCTASITVNVDVEICEGLKTVVPAQVFQLYPNPVNDILFLKTNGQKEVTVEILDVMGRPVSELTLPLHADEAKRIDLTALIKGMYFINIKSAGENAQCFKILKL